MVLQPDTPIILYRDFDGSSSNILPSSPLKIAALHELVCYPESLTPPSWVYTSIHPQFFRLVDSSKNYSIMNSHIPFNTRLTLINLGYASVKYAKIKGYSKNNYKGEAQLSHDLISLLPHGKCLLYRKVLP
jgi:hypothetical protein